MVLKRRWTSRVLLVDECDRLLLLCGRDPRKPGARWWFTVGGGLEDGEDYVQAAVRETREETALSLPVQRLSSVVWTRQAVFTVDGQGFDQYEEYRLAHHLRRGKCNQDRYGRGSTRTSLVDDRGTCTTSETVRPKKMASLLVDVLTTSTHRPAPRDLVRQPPFEIMAGVRG
ncbi:NUDIX hydrolase [Streptomyces sp. NBC_00481]|uniref:NUDIX hydrolase n=1 Tax=unclassified Streptomyces TaxID=2593676 RepID=UPI003FA3B792